MCSLRVDRVVIDLRSLEGICICKVAGHDAKVWEEEQVKMYSMAYSKGPIP
jgi:hypothetical protein